MWTPAAVELLMKKLPKPDMDGLRGAVMAALEVNFENREVTVDDVLEVLARWGVVAVAHHRSRGVH